MFFEEPSLASLSLVLVLSCLGLIGDVTILLLEIEQPEEKSILIALNFILRLLAWNTSSGVFLTLAKPKLALLQHFSNVLVFRLLIPL